MALIVFIYKLIFDNRFIYLQLYIKWPEILHLHVEIAFHQESQLQILGHHFLLCKLCRILVQYEVLLVVKPLKLDDCGITVRLGLINPKNALLDQLLSEFHPLDE